MSDIIREFVLSARLYEIYSRSVGMRDPSVVQNLYPPSKPAGEH